MNGFFSQLSVRRWLFNVTLMCLLLGGLLAATLNTQAGLKRDLGLEGGAQGGRLPWLVQTLKEQRDTNENLKGTIQGLRKQVEKYETAVADTSKTTDALNKEVQDLKLLSGLTTVKGQGVVVTLDDNKKSSLLQSQSEDANGFPMYIVHDWDLRAFVSELFASGAEAVSINEHRLSSRSSIRCVGPVIMVNGDPAAPPFVIKAIGDSKALASALNMPGGVVDSARADGVGPKVKVEPSAGLEIPPFTGGTNFKYARQVPSKG
ncbi:MAG: DUF881 domain-containing protein [Armatimonadetes bacterium]|nr:DUF881 domain-containing protein [Armatimonadota bacterium]